MIPTVFTYLDAQGMESPAGFDPIAAVEKLKTILPMISQAAGAELTIDSDVEDATFFCTVGLIGNQSPPSFLLCINFSNFGDLCFVWGQDLWMREHQEAVLRVEAALTKHGYRVVNNDEADAPYTGIHLKWSARTWYERFFSYC